MDCSAKNPVHWKIEPAEDFEASGHVRFQHIKTGLYLEFPRFDESRDGSKPWLYVSTNAPEKHQYWKLVLAESKG